MLHYTRYIIIYTRIFKNHLVRACRYKNLVTLASQVVKLFVEIVKFLYVVVNAIYTLRS